jgi:ABC-type polysaccharide/polyol phosphate transport system ATPase subunit
MNDDEKQISVQVTNLTKTFKIPLEASNGLKQKLVNTLKGRKGYREFTPLHDISFSIEKGDFFGIVGRNGSGKSTLLKTIAQIYVPDGGSVSVNGKLVPFIELGVGFNPELTGRENIFLNGALLGFSRKEMEAMYDEIIDFAELHDFMEERLKNYSSGMQVRLAFSIAIKAKGDILLLDEVLAVGDEAFQKKCNKYFSAIKKDSTKTIILVTHSMESVRRYCNKALLLDEGEIVGIGDPNEIADSYSRLFLGDSGTSITDQNRYGTGEVVFDNVNHTLTDDSLILDFDIINKTTINFSDITMGFDFCINGDIVTGNDTRYLEGYNKGILLGAKEQKHFTVTFPNTFGNHQFTLNIGLTTGLGVNVTDNIRSVIEFDSNNIRYSNAFKILSFPYIDTNE